MDRARVPAHPQALEQDPHQIVGYRGARNGAPPAYILCRGDDRLRVHARHALTVDDGNAYLAAGVAGMGALWLPRYMAHASLARGELVPLFEEWQLEPMPLYVAFAPGRHVSRKLRLFIDWIVELMAQHAPAILPPAIPAPAAASTPPAVGVGRAVATGKDKRRSATPP